MKRMNITQLYRAIAASFIVMAAITIAQAGINIEKLGVHPQQPYYERMMGKYSLNCEVEFKSNDAPVIVTQFTHTTSASPIPYLHSVQDFWKYAKIIYAGAITDGPNWNPQIIPYGARVVFMWPYPDFTAPLPTAIYPTLTFKNAFTGEAQSVTFEIKPVEYKLHVARGEYHNSYIFPLKNQDPGFEWYIVQGHELDRVHHRQIMVLGNDGTPLFNQRYAHDIVMRNQSTGKFAGSGNGKEVSYIWGKEVVAVAGGYVCIVKNDEEDIEIGENYSGNWPGGNRVVINHLNGQSSVYFHLKKGSIPVNQGQWVNQGDLIGQVGNSGNTSGPHLHFQIQPQNPLAIAPCATGDVENLPVYFQNIFVRSGSFPWLTMKWNGGLATNDAVFVQ